MQHGISGVVVVLSLWAAAEPLLDADAIAEHHLKALGGAPALRAMRSRRMSGTLTAADGATRQYLSERKRPNLCRTESRSADRGTRVRGYNGKSAWSVSSGDAVRILSGAEAQEHIDACEFDETPLLDFAKRGIRVVYAGPVNVDGTPAHKLDIVTPSGAKSVLYIDRSTWREFRTDYLERDGTVIVARTRAQGGCGRVLRDDDRYYGRQRCIPAPAGRGRNPSQRSHARRAVRSTQLVCGKWDAE